MDRACSQPCRGFSLLELIVTLSIAGVLLGLGVPAFTRLLLDSKRTTAVNSFVHSIYLARTSALNYGQTISICRSLDGETCINQTADWQVGWIVFVNADRDEPPVRDANELLLSTRAAKSDPTISSNRRSYSFKPYEHGVINGTLVFCDRRGPTQARAIILNHAGRPRISTRDSNGRPLRCPSG